MPVSFVHQRVSKAALLVGFWTVVGGIYIFTSLIITLTAGGADRPLTLERAVFIMLGWYTWIPSTLIVMALVRHFPLDRVRGWWAAGVHMVAAPLVSLFASLLFTGMRGMHLMLQGQALDGGFAANLQGTFLRSVALDSVIYMTILVGVHAFEYYRRYRERELRTTQLEAELAEARLHALRLQLQPHFLFNTFHTIAMLVRQQRDEAAIDTIAVLSEFLRYVLEHTGAQEVSLQQELRFLESYLAIEQIRFQDALTVDVQVDADAHRARVPNLMLQPLVENAIRHGIEPTRLAGRIEVSARREGDRLRLHVRDNGGGLPDDWRLDDGEGIGLANTRARLERLYGDDHRLTLTNAPDGGLLVTIVIPYHPVEDAHEPRSPTASREKVAMER